MSSENQKPEWSDEFFAGAAWGDFLAATKPEETTRKEADGVRKFLSLPEGSRILDVPCGNGRIGIPLALSGYEVTGIDLDPQLIEQATANAARIGAAFAARRSDMRDLPWWDEFDGAINYWSSFGYFDDEGNRQFAEAVWRSLKPGAPFLIETLVADTLLRNYQESESQRVGDWTLTRERAYDHVDGRINATWTFLKEGSVEAHRMSLRLYTYRELCELLRSCGFAEFEGYDTETGERFSIHGTRLTLVARKEA